MPYLVAVAGFLTELLELNILELGRTDERVAGCAFDNGKGAGKPDPAQG